MVSKSHIFLSKANHDVFLAELMITHPELKSDVDNLDIQAFLESGKPFNELVEEGITSGEIRPVDSWLVTQFVMAMAFEVLRESSLRQEPLDPRQAAQSVTEILFEGISR